MVSDDVYKALLRLWHAGWDCPLSDEDVALLQVFLNDEAHQRGFGDFSAADEEYQRERSAALRGEVGR